MQFTASILALAAAMTVSAQDPPVFSVVNFTAGCIPHSSQCSYDFGLYQPGSGGTPETAVHCSAMLVSDGTLPVIPNGNCTNSSRTWTISKPGDGSLIFNASQQVTLISFYEGGYVIPATDLNISTTGASTQQSYVGPSSFDLED